MSEQAMTMPAEESSRASGMARLGRSILAQRTALIVALLGLWELSGLFLFNPFWSSRPSLIFERIGAMALSGELWRHTSTTLEEAGIGLLLAAVVGVAVGIALARAPHVAKVVEPIIMGLYGLPRVALAPLFILWFGIGLFSKVMMSFTMVVFVFILNVIEGVGTIDSDHLDLMHSMRASRLYQVRRVLLPAIVPWILASFRIGIGLALIGAVVGELIGANRGLGWYIQDAGGALDTTGVFSGLIVLMAIAMAANQIVAYVERKVLSWR